jgi:hypothetical protein
VALVHGACFGMATSIAAGPRRDCCR